MENPYLKTLDSYIQFWENCHFNDKVNSIKESLGTISKSQEASVKSRKELASKTKEIRTIPANERMNYMKGLLKLYQDEIDHLTIRSQFAENLLSSYSSELTGLVDPLSVLKESKAMYERYVHLLEDSERLDTENNELQQQVQSLEELNKEQSTASSEINSLRSQIEKLKQTNQQLQNEVVQKEKERKSFLQSISNAKALEEENQHLHQQIETLTMEINQYYSISNNEGNASQWSDQLSIFHKQIENLQDALNKEQEKSAKLQRQYDEYEERIAQQLEGYESQVLLLNQEIEKDAVHIEALVEKQRRTEQPVNRGTIKSEDVSSLISDLKNSLQEVKKEKEKMEIEKQKEIDDLKQTLLSQNKQHEIEINELNKELRERCTPTEMNKLKSILITLQRIGIPVEFNETSDLPIPQVETVLLEKIQHLETSNSNLRSTFNDIYNKYMKSENDRHVLEEQVVDQSENIKQMESQISQLEQRVIPSQSTNIQQEGFSGNVEGILKDQRDRYKRRVDELELERNRDKASLDSLYSVINQLKKELSEKQTISVSVQEYPSTGKYHSSELSENPLEKAAFRVAQEMVCSPQFRTFITYYILVVHFLLLLLFIHYYFK